MELERWFNLHRTVDDAVLADRIPLEEESDMSRVRNNCTTMGWKMSLSHKRTPKDWKALFVPGETYISVHHKGLSQPLMGYYITDTPTSGDGFVGFDGTSLEGFLLANAYVPVRRSNGAPFRFDLEDVVSVIGAEIGGALENAGVGMRMIVDAPPSGILRTKYYNDYDDITIGQALTDLGLVWNIFLRWETPAKDRLVKVLEIRHPDSFTTTTDLAFDAGKNIISFDYSAPMNGSESATRLIVIGDGSGNLRARSDALTDDETEQRMVRRELRLKIPGLKSVDDCNLYAQAIRSDYFTRRNFVTLMARDNGATRFEDIMNMDKCALVNIPGYYEELSAVVGWTIGKTLRAFSPSMMRLTDGAVKFPKTVDPAVSPSKDSDVSSNPNELGVYVPKPDGSGAWVIDPSTGPGFMDGDGNLLGNRSDEVFVEQLNAYSLSILKNSQGIDFLKGADFENPEATASIRLKDAANGIPNSQALVLTGPGLPQAGGFIRIEDTGNIGMYSRYGVAVRTGFSGTDVGYNGKPTVINGNGIRLVSVFGAIREEGNVTVTGSHTVEGAKQFGMVHPADPTKYLRHASTESPVNGVEYWEGSCVVGPDSSTVVELPEYFEALTKPGQRAVFLTPVNSRSTFCTSEIVDGKFTVQADPGTLLNWLVKAVRVSRDFDGNDKLAFDAVTYREITNE
jgi:hypothetical protein